MPSSISSFTRCCISSLVGSVTNSEIIFLRSSSTCFAAIRCALSLGCPLSNRRLTICSTLAFSSSSKGRGVSVPCIGAAAINAASSSVGSILEKGSTIEGGLSSGTRNPFDFAICSAEGMNAACFSSCADSRKLDLTSNGADTPSAKASINTSTGLFSPVAFCATNSPPAPPPICMESSLLHAATVAFLAAVPVNLPAAIKSFAGFKNRPAKPIESASKPPTIKPRFWPLSLISAMILGLFKALDIAMGSSMLTPLSWSTSVMTAPYSIPPEDTPAKTAAGIAPAGPSTKAGAIAGKDVATDSISIVIVARGFVNKATAASP